MGEARRRKQPHGFQPNPTTKAWTGQRHVLALIDRRMDKDESGELVMSDHSAKPGRYASANLKTLYHWDGIRLRRLDRQTLQPHNEGHL